MVSLIKYLLHLFRGLRGKLTLTYTLVTVLALLALEMLVLLASLALTSVTKQDERDYLYDIISTLAPQARTFLQPQADNKPGSTDITGLQDWLNGVYEMGYASAPAATVFDSPAAPIVREYPLYVLSPTGIVLAQAPRGENDLVGRRYDPPDLPGADKALLRAMDGQFDPIQLSARLPEDRIFFAMPVTEDGRNSQLVGVIVLAVQPPPSMLLSRLPVILGWVLLTALVLLLAVVPFGALFGFIMASGLTRRLGALTTAADAWSYGNFNAMPVDRSNDEIGYLAVRMRNMAERIQQLLQSQQELATMEERSRLARELHDTVKQQTFATLMQVRAARNELITDPESAAKHLEESEALLKTTQQDLGLMITELRPSALEGQGLAGALGGYLEGWSQHSRIPADYQVSGERALPLAVEQALYRVAQEALANVDRHSRASAVTVRLACENGLACLTVSDNGLGFDLAQGPNGKNAAAPSAIAQPSGYGLQSMRERLALLNGSFDVNSSSENGTTITACVPIERISL